MTECSALFAEDNLRCLVVTSGSDTPCIEWTAVLLIGTEFLLGNGKIRFCFQRQANRITSIHPFREDIISLRRK